LNDWDEIGLGPPYENERSMQLVKLFFYITGLILAVLLSVIYRLLYIRGTGDRDWKRVLNYGSDLYALSCKGNLNHVWNLLNPMGMFDKVFTVCSDPRSLQLEMKEDWLIPVLLLRFPWMKMHQLLNLCRRERVGLYRCRELGEPVVFGLCLKIALGIPMILSTGGDHRLSQDLRRKYYFGNRKLSFLVEELAYRHADLIFCINEYTQRLIEDLGGGHRNTLMLNPIRIDGDVFNPEKYDGASLRRRGGIDIAGKVILYVGRLEYDKQVDIFFAAIPVVLSEFPTALFYVIGDGPLRHSLEERAAREGFLESVLFKGFMANEDLPDYYSIADVVCIPMSGFVIYEAAAMQRPIVALDVDWHAEFVEDRVTGLLIANRDVEKLAEGILLLLRDKELAMELARNARRRFTERYEPKTLVKREAGLLKEFCHNLSRGRG
jgi:phosphatidylinositol alpha-1,6-mannosyltransferase